MAIKEGEEVGVGGRSRRRGRRVAVCLGSLGSGRGLQQGLVCRGAGRRGCATVTECGCRSHGRPPVGETDGSLADGGPRFRVTGSWRAAAAVCGRVGDWVSGERRDGRDGGSESMTDAYIGKG